MISSQFEVKLYGELPSRNEPTNRADLVTWVFELKKQQMLDEIFKDGIDPRVDD